MTSFEHALADYGREIGVDRLVTGESGTVQLRFERGATLGFSRQGDDVVLHWSEPVHYDMPSTLLRAFKQVAEPEVGQPALQVGLHRGNHVDSLVLATRVPESDCSDRILRQRVDWLRQYVGALCG